MTNAEAWFNKSLRPRKPEGSLGRTAQDGHLDSHAAPELCQILDLHLSFPSIDITQIVVVCVDVFVKYTGLSHREYQMSHYGGVKTTL